MNVADFQNFKIKFQSANVNEKIKMYTSVNGITQGQYSELLRMFPIDKIHLLEEAL